MTVGDSDARLRIPDPIVRAMVDHARREAPMECCGLLGGVGERVRSIHPLINESASSTEYLVTVGLFEPMKRMRRLGEELLAIYHSHPATAAVPSRVDLKRNLYPGTVHVIVSLATAQASVRAYLLEGETYREVAWERWRM